MIYNWLWRPRSSRPVHELDTGRVIHGVVACDTDTGYYLRTLTPAEAAEVDILEDQPQFAFCRHKAGLSVG